MADENKSIRTFQLFRNGSPYELSLTQDVDSLKTIVSNAGITLADGEPIAVRYKEFGDDTIKVLFGIGYVNGDTRRIIWKPEIIINGGDYITSTENPDGTFEVKANAVKISELTKDNDGLAIASDVKEYVDNAVENIEIPEYTIVKQDTAEEGFISTYNLTKDGVKVGASINIPKDFLVKSGTVKTVEEEDVPYEGAKVGDKYIDFVVNVKEGSATDEHLYIPANDLVDVYTAGVGISINENNEISLDEEYVDELIDLVNDKITGLGSVDAGEGKYFTNIGVDKNGNLVAETGDLPTDTVTTVLSGNNGIYVTTDSTDEHKYSISVNNSAELGNILEIKQDGLYVPNTGVTINNVQGVDIASKTGDVKFKLNKIYDKWTVVEDTEGDIIKEGGHKYIVIITSDENTYWVVNDATDIHVSSFNVNTNDKTLVIGMNNNTSFSVSLNDLGVQSVSGETAITDGNTQYVAVSTTTDEDNKVTLTSSLKVANISYTEGDENIKVAKSGVLTNDNLNVIKEYVDKFDCGFFKLNQQSTL